MKVTFTLGFPEAEPVASKNNLDALPLTSTAYAPEGTSQCCLLNCSHLERGGRREGGRERERRKMNGSTSFL